MDENGTAVLGTEDVDELEETLVGDRGLSVGLTVPVVFKAVFNVVGIS